MLGQPLVKYDYPALDFNLSLKISLQLPFVSSGGINLIQTPGVDPTNPEGIIEDNWEQIRK
jgi:hypothetical protein